MRILIIDDSKFIRTVYKSELNQENIEVELAETGEEGLEKARTAKPDVILLDMMLPGIDGFEVLERLKNDSGLRKIPVVVFSTLSQQSDIEEALKRGAVKYLPKDDYTPKKVAEELKQILVLLNK